MTRFDESWLREYRRRRAGDTASTIWPENVPRKPPGAIPAPAGPKHPDIVFRLSRPLLLPNRKKNLHWTDISRIIHDLSDEAARAISNAPAETIAFASVGVLRYGLKEPDDDNLRASLKMLLDILQPRSKRHPYGLGIIADDDPEHLTSEIHHIQVHSFAEQQTIVRVRDLGRKITP
jgi:hypothetical protein